MFTVLSPDHTIPPQVAFVSLSLVNALTRPLTFLPKALASLVQVRHGVLVAKYQPF